MNSALEYMTNLRPTLVNEYRTPDRRYSESCALIAVDIAKRLLAENKTPYIAVVRGKLIDSINRADIIPKPFQGRILWGAHLLCCENGLAYDPMVDSKPLAINNYCTTAFEGEVDMNIIVAQEQIKEFVKR